MKDKIYKILKSLATKWAIKRLFGAAIGGIGGFIASLSIEAILDKLAKPIYLYLVRKGKIIAKAPEVKAKTKELEESKNETDFNSSVDNLP